MTSEKTFFSQEELALKINKQYSNNPAQFIVDFTRLFYDIDGSYNAPYRKQVEFLNCLRPEDRVVTVLKARQCIDENTLLNTHHGKRYTIRDLHDSNYKGLIYSVDENGEIVLDKIKAIWYSGTVESFQVFTKSGHHIKGSSEHFINTKNGWKQISDLTLDDELVVTDDLKTTFFSQIESIKSVGIRNVYDLETENTESYFANGIHVHNCGISTAIVGYAVHQAYFAKYPEIMIISATKEQALKIMRRVKQCFYDMPEGIKPILTQDSAQKIELANGVKIVSLSSNPQAMRGWTGLWLWDECTMNTIREQKEIWEAIYPSITKGGKIIMISTPFGQEGVFFDFCTKSLSEITGNENASTDIRRFYIHWKEVPHIVKAVKSEGLFDALDPETIAQEYELQFRAENEEEQFFPRDFILSYFREINEVIPLYKSYIDLGIPYTYAMIENLKTSEVPEEFYLYDLKEKYERITAGWDIASTENDSVLSVVGHLKGNKIRHKIGEFLVNRVGNGFHDLEVQIQYIQNILKVMQVDKINIDKTGMGRGVYDSIKNHYPYFYNICFGFDYNVEDKITSFSTLKTLMTNGYFKRSWQEGKQTSECLKQYTNIKLNKIKNTLASKGRHKDDIPNADMLANVDTPKRPSKITSLDTSLKVDNLKVQNKVFVKPKFTL